MFFKKRELKEKGIKKRETKDDRMKYYEVDCVYYKIFLTEPELKKYGIDYNELVSVDQNQMTQMLSGKEDIQRSILTSLEQDYIQPKMKLSQSPSFTRPFNMKRTMEACISSDMSPTASIQKTKSQRQRGLCISLNEWLMSFTGH